MNQSKVTDNTHEMSFHELLSQSAQLQIPLFQREYVWTDKQLIRMLNELDAVIDGEDANRFLGAVIGVRRASNPAAPQIFELVDGQQRLTTLYLLVVAAAFIAAKNGHDDYATGLVNTSLVLTWWQNSSNTKLITSYSDRAQLNTIYKQLFNSGKLSDWLGAKTKLPEPSGKLNGKLTNQFDRIRKILQKRHNDFGIEHIQNLVEAATTKLTFVFILLRDPSNATTVFKGLNDPGIPIGIGDLIRNEVFSKVSEKPDEAFAIHRDYWLPFREKLGDHFDNYFFPFSIIYEPGTKNADLFLELQKIWKKESFDPKDIIEKLDEYSEEYLALCANQFPSFYDKDIVKRLKNLRQANNPSSTYPFLMKVLKEYKNETLDVRLTIEILDGIESFLVRRALCGIEPTGLLVMFRTLWNNIKNNPSREELFNSINKRSTVEWPDDEKFKNSIQSRSIYSGHIAKYAILEYEKSLNADFPEISNPWIEHVLPQKLTSDWEKIFTKELHEKLVHTWGNLIPLSSQMNQVLSQSLYDIKNDAISKDSMYASGRRLTDEYSIWNESSIRSRNQAIANWAITRWKR